MQKQQNYQRSDLRAVTFIFLGASIFNFLFLSLEH